jgi:YD repeat-containing protein
LGRTVSVVAPDGASTATSAYSGNTTTITDPAGKWKKQTVDVFGNLTQVNEPNPATGADYVTTYAYDLLNHLTLVTMPRPTGKQTRTFAYDTTTQRLMSETHPETGTTSYGYNTDGTLASKTNARNQVTKYAYDTYQRVTGIQKYPNPSQPTTADACQQVSYTYDTATGSQNAWGRLAAVQWGDPNLTCSAMNYHKFTYTYSYTYAGLITSKRLQVAGLTAGTLSASYTYNNEGMVASVTHPLASNDAQDLHVLVRPHGASDQLSGQPVHTLCLGAGRHLWTG